MFIFTTEMDGTEDRCILCRKGPNVALGEFLKTTKYGFHYVCLLLAPALYQKEKEDNGYYGFIVKDIIREEKRINKQRCSYCRLPHANLSCVIKKCPRSFHVDCGLQNGCQYRMTDFQTYCTQHRELEKETIHMEQHLCAICSDTMGPFHYNESINASCCTESWYHRNCMAVFADRAGYFFKCPLCNNKEEFRNKVMEQGIFVPERDAAWELEPNAFADHHVRPNECVAEKCQCTRGRKYAPKEGTVWRMIYCQVCGGKSIHEPCLRGSDFICDECAQMGANCTSNGCQDLSQESVDPQEEDDSALNELQPCWVVLVDVAKIRSKKLRMSSETPPSIMIPTSPQVITRRSDYHIVRVVVSDCGPSLSPVPYSRLNKRPSDQESQGDESHLKKMKKSRDDSPLLISPREANLMLRNEFLNHHSTPESTSSDESQLENRPSSSSIDLTNRMLHYRFLKHRVTPENDSQVENRPPSPFASSSKPRSSQHSAHDPQFNLKQMKINFFFHRNLNNNMSNK